jgi:hypothetical protein
MHRNGYPGGRYVHLAAGMPGDSGNIYVILDIANPTNPVEAGRWRVPGQHEAGGETPEPAVSVHGPPWPVGDLVYSVRRRRDGDPGHQRCELAAAGGVWTSLHRSSATPAYTVSFRCPPVASQWRTPRPSPRAGGRRSITRQRWTSATRPTPCSGRPSRFPRLRRVRPSRASTSAVAASGRTTRTCSTTVRSPITPRI